MTYFFIHRLIQKLWILPTWVGIILTIGVIFEVLRTDERSDRILDNIYRNKRILSKLTTDNPVLSRNCSKKSLFSNLFNKKRFFGFLILTALVIPFSARAGIFAFMTDILIGPRSEASTKAETIQNMSLLEATGTNNPNASTSQIDTPVVDDSSFLAEAGPLGGVADIASSSAITSDQISLYTVRKGDTLSGIGDMFNVTINTILWANDLKRGAVVHEGDTLVILPISGLQYTVKKGDTLASIAKKYGGDKGGIMVFNNLDSEKLTVGQIVIIPDGDATVPAPVKKVIVDKNGKQTVVYQDSRPNYVGYYSWPVSGGRKSQGLHGSNGIDIAAPAGTPILAAADGIVILVREGGYNGGYGNYMVIKHPNGTQTLYAHALYLSVEMGQTVAKGQTIGAVGSTGRSTGNHLHFEVRGARNPF